MYGFTIVEFIMSVDVFREHLKVYLPVLTSTVADWYLNGPLMRTRLKISEEELHLIMLMVIILF